MTCEVLSNRPNSTFLLKRPNNFSLRSEFQPHGEERLVFSLSRVHVSIIFVISEIVNFSCSCVFRFNAFYAQQAIKWQPVSEDPGVTKNSIRWRGLEGFVAAVSPFNFTAIGGNLAYTPAMMVRFSCRRAINEIIIKRGRQGQAERE